MRERYGAEAGVSQSFSEAVAAAIPAKKTAQVFLHFLNKRYGGDPLRMSAEPSAKLRAELLGLKGVGSETADAILLVVLGHSIFAISVHAYRVFTRHALAAEDSSYEELQEIAASVPADLEKYRRFHALLTRVGKDYCRAVESCEACPLKGINW